MSSLGSGNGLSQERLDEIRALKPWLAGCSECGGDSGPYIVRCERHDEYGALNELLAEVDRLRGSIMNVGEALSDLEIAGSDPAVLKVIRFAMEADPEVARTVIRATEDTG